MDDVIKSVETPSGISNGDSACAHVISGVVNTTKHGAACAALTSQLHDDDDDDENDQCWKEEEKCDETLAVCLFCDNLLPLSTFMAHCSTVHGVNIADKLQSIRDSPSDESEQCDDIDYDFVRLINYIRSHKLSAERVVQLAHTEWRSDRYLQPALADDPVLTLDISEFCESCPNDEVVGNVSQPCSPSRLESGEAGAGDRLSAGTAGGDGRVITLPAAHYRMLVQRLQRAEAGSQSLQQRMSEDMETMRRAMRRIVAEDDTVSCRSPASNNSAGDGYFSTYSHHGIHHEMVTDRVRTDAYHQAITSNADCISGRRVVDVGCGCGILSLFCASAGASHVLAVDASEAALWALDVVHENRQQSVVEVKHGRVEDVVVAAASSSHAEHRARYDVLVSEWMGYMLLFEGMLESVLWARDHLLAPGGLMLPNRCTLLVRAVADEQRYDHMVDMWRHVYGFQMSCLRRSVLSEASVELVPGSKCCSSAALLHDIDLYTVNAQQASHFTSHFSLTATRTALVTALVVHFDVMFDLPVPVRFSCDSEAEPTHWKQTVFYLPQHVAVTEGDTIAGTFSCSSQPHDSRALRVVITMAGQCHTYNLS